MRWLLVLIALAGFVGAVMTDSPGVLGLCLVLGFVATFAAAFAFAHARIESNARPASLSEVDLAVMQASIAAKTPAAKSSATEGDETGPS